MDEQPQEEPPPPGTEETPPAAEDNPAEKKVGINDDPEVFIMNPESTEVTPVKRSIPCPPPMDQQVLDKIIADTESIVTDEQKQCDEQKMAIQKMAFMLTLIQESLGVYENQVNKINSFLVNNERLQATWFCKYRKGLSCFNEYPLALKDSPEKIQVDELPFPVKETDLKKLAEDSVNNLYAGGTVVRATRVICGHVNDKIDLRREFVGEECSQFDSWFKLMNRANDNQDSLLEMLFKVKANCNFLKTGEITDALVLDISKEMEKLNQVEMEEKKAEAASAPTSAPALAPPAPALAAEEPTPS